MDTDMEMVLVTEKEYKSLLGSQAMLTALEDAGVDNWDGIDFAYESLDEIRAELGLEKEDES